MPYYINYSDFAFRLKYQKVARFLSRKKWWELGDQQHSIQENEEDRVAIGQGK
jgi:hypothetical protein